MLTLGRTSGMSSIEKEHSRGPEVDYGVLTSTLPLSEASSTSPGSTMVEGGPYLGWSRDTTLAEKLAEKA